MTELKTLKDIKTDWLTSTTKRKGWTFVNTTILRQAAIKWIKACKREGGEGDRCDCKNHSKPQINIPFGCECVLLG